jgi:hypothetical protein
MGWDVPIDEAASYALYELLVVVAPGVAVIAALCPRPRGWPWRLAVGWGLGLALEVAMFVATAMLDVPSAHAPACVAVGGLAALAWGLRRRRAPSSLRPHVDAGWSRWAAAAAATVLLFVTTVGFVGNPLPGKATVTYDADITFALSMAAEAKHHWPVTDPKIVGEQLPYHTFVYFHLAGASRATGIDLSTIYLRLYLGPLVFLACLQLAELARRLGRAPSAGGVAIGLAFLIGELDLVPGRQGVFLNFIFFDLFVSPTFVLGVVLLGALILLLFDSLERPAREHGGRLAALLALAAGCAGAKGAILPILGLGLGGFLLASRVRSGTWRRDGLVGLGGIFAIWLAFQIWWYEGERVGATMDPLRTLELMPVTAEHADAFDWLPAGEQLYLALTAPVVAVGICGALLVGVALALRSRRRLDDRRLLLLCLLAATVVPFLIVFHPGYSQMFFIYYGLLAACPLAAHGLVAGYRRWRQARPDDRPWMLLFIVALGVALAVQALVPVPAPLTSWETARWYLLLAAVLALLTLFWRLNALGLGPTWLVAMVAGLLTTAAVDRPLDEFTPIVQRLNRDRPPQYQGLAPLTPELAQGLDWLRAHTTPDTVVASNAQYLDRARERPLLIRVTAFAERRVFLEGWGHTIRAQSLATGDFERPPEERRPAYPDRLALNRRAFVLASPSAFAELRSAYGVRVLWVDKVNGPWTPALARRAMLVYDNQDCSVYALVRPPPGTPGTRSGS